MGDANKQNDVKPNDQIIWLHQQAPSKPPLGQSCNGCGVCCAAEPCPVARVFLGQWRGTCRALEWNEDAMQYRCGMLQRPEHYARYLPTFLHHKMRLWIRRWIAADTACDSDADVIIKAKL
jgi:hypothetical protein